MSARKIKSFRETKPGEVWKSPSGWRAKNQDGSAQTFDDKSKAEQYAKGKDKEKEDTSSKSEQSKASEETVQALKNIGTTPTETTMSEEKAKSFVGKFLDKAKSVSKGMAKVIKEAPLATKQFITDTEFRKKAIKKSASVLRDNASYIAKTIVASTKSEAVDFARPFTAPVTILSRLKNGERPLLSEKEKFSLYSGSVYWGCIIGSFSMSHMGGYDGVTALDAMKEIGDAFMHSFTIHAALGAVAKWLKDLFKKNPPSKEQVKKAIDSGAIKVDDVKKAIEKELEKAESEISDEEAESYLEQLGEMNDDPNKLFLFVEQIENTNLFLQIFGAAGFIPSNFAISTGALYAYSPWAFGKEIFSKGADIITKLGKEDEPTVKEFENFIKLYADQMESTTDDDMLYLSTLDSKPYENIHKELNDGVEKAKKEEKKKNTKKALQVKMARSVAIEYLSRQSAYTDKKKVVNQDGKESTVYVYSDEHIRKRHKEKSKKIEKLRKCLSELRSKYRRDIESEDERKSVIALAVSLIDLTYERVGNPISADNGHFGITGLQKRHIKFSSGKATLTYVGKSGVKQTKEITNEKIVSRLKEITKKKSKEDNIFTYGEDDRCVSARLVNTYLKDFGISAKDIRGYHANEEMKKALKSIRKENGKLPSEDKDKAKQLKKEFATALKQVAKIVGHQHSTLKNQYLVPHLKEKFLESGKVITSLKTATKSQSEKEDEQIEDIHKKNPKERPPRFDLRKRRIEEEDKDLDTTDKDLSLKHEDYKRASLEERVAMMWLYGKEEKIKVFNKNKKTVTEILPRTLQRYPSVYEEYDPFKHRGEDGESDPEFVESDVDDDEDTEEEWLVDLMEDDDWLLEDDSEWEIEEPVTSDSDNPSDNKSDNKDDTEDKKDTKEEEEPTITYNSPSLEDLKSTLGTLDPKTKETTTKYVQDYVSTLSKRITGGETLTSEEITETLEQSDPDKVIKDHKSAMATLTKNYETNLKKEGITDEEKEGLKEQYEKSLENEKEEYEKNLKKALVGKTLRDLVLTNPKNIGGAEVGKNIASSAFIQISQYDDKLLKELEGKIDSTLSESDPERYKALKHSINTLKVMKSAKSGFAAVLMGNMTPSDISDLSKSEDLKKAFNKVGDFMELDELGKQKKIKEIIKNQSFEDIEKNIKSDLFKGWGDKLYKNPQAAGYVKELMAEYYSLYESEEELEQMMKSYGKETKSKSKSKSPPKTQSGKNLPKKDFIDELLDFDIDAITGSPHESHYEWIRGTNIIAQFLRDNGEISDTDIEEIRSSLGKIGDFDNISDDDFNTLISEAQVASNYEPGDVWKVEDWQYEWGALNKKNIYAYFEEIEDAENFAKGIVKTSSYFQSFIYNSINIDSGLSITNSTHSIRRDNIMSKISKQSALKVSSQLDRIATLFENSFRELGVPEKIAQDFSYRCDLLSDTIESNFGVSKQALDNLDPVLEPGFNPDDIGREQGGAIEDQGEHAWMGGEFSLQEHRELRDLQESGDMANIQEDPRAPQSGRQAKEEEKEEKEEESSEEEKSEKEASLESAIARLSKQADLSAISKCSALRDELKICCIKLQESGVASVKSLASACDKLVVALDKIKEECIKAEATGADSMELEMSCAKACNAVEEIVPFMQRLCGSIGHLDHDSPVAQYQVEEMLEQSSSKLEKLVGLAVKIVADALSEMSKKED